jgi:hypothetical protein
VSAYEAIYKQIEREDNLYIARFNAWVVFNLLLAAAAASQIQPESQTQAAAYELTRFLAFTSSCVFAIVMSVIVNGLLESGTKQVAYLHEQYYNGVRDDSFAGLPRPFSENSLPSNKFTPRGWSQIPFYVMFSWIIALITGLIIMCPRGTCTNGILKCLNMTTI